jgi:hypothetical protein
MKQLLSLCLAILACGANAQHLISVYNRDTNEQFKLKSVLSESLIRGPMVTQQATYTFDNPFKELTEASVWFGLDNAAILSGFGYWYKDEYVPGQLMDKNKAWFIYTAITSRNEDPGIVGQVSSSKYHAQIYPLAAGYDFRVQLNSVGFLQSDQGKLTVSQPSFNEAVYPQMVRSTQPDTVSIDTSTVPAKTVVTYPKDPKLDMQVYAQKHKDGYTYVAGMVRMINPEANLKVSGIHKVYWSRPEGAGSEGGVKLFIGRRRGPGVVRITSTDAFTKYVKSHFIKGNEKGSDAAKLWAHQKLDQDDWRTKRALLRFSLKYEVPSSETALLAVPQAQMKLFKQKAAEYRRNQAEESRKPRKWQQERAQNWSTSSGGDPEIRAYFPNAQRVYAVLPSGKSFDLVKAEDGYWGGNYDIPADAPEGDYQVKVLGVDRSGHETEQDVNYKVDRTAPQGKLRLEDGTLILQAEKGLARTVVVFKNGAEDTMKETSPGEYRLFIGTRQVEKVVLIDQAHNVSELVWSR